MFESGFGPFKKKVEEAKKGAEGLGVAFHDLDMLTSRLDRWAPAEYFDRKTAAIKARKLSPIREGILLELVEIEAQLRWAAAAWGAAGGNSHFFDSIGKGYTNLVDFCEGRVNGTSSDSDINTLCPMIIRRFQLPVWASFRERDIVPPTTLVLQGTPQTGQNYNNAMVPTSSLSGSGTQKPDSNPVSGVVRTD